VYCIGAEMLVILAADTAIAQITISKAGGGCFPAET
jgi:hypothetical protein